jgi:hypothetical protein
MVFSAATGDGPWLAQTVAAPHIAAQTGRGRNSGKTARADGEAMNVRVALFGIFMLTAALRLSAGGRMTLKVSPVVGFAPVNLIVRASIVADADNRAMEIVAESRDFYRSSTVQLEGEKAPRTSQFEFRSLPSGVYEVRANLFGSNGTPRASIRQQINVMASGTGER